MSNINIIIVFLACIMAIAILGRMLILPIKLIIKLIFNSLLGGLIIIIINLIGVVFSVHIGLNIFTALFVRDTWNSRSDTAYNI